MSVLGMKDRDAAADKRRFVFRSAHSRDAVMYILDEMQNILKYQYVQMTFHTCFIEFFKGFFISQNIQPLKRLGNPNFVRDWTWQQTKTTKITVVTDWRAFTVRIYHDAADVDVDWQPPWGSALVTQEVLDN